MSFNSLMFEHVHSISPKDRERRREIHEEVYATNYRVLN